MKERKRASDILQALPKVTAALVLVNVILFAVCTFGNGILYNEWSVGVRLIKNGGWYRIITAMFLHADIEHLISNMLILYCAGEMVERVVGSVKFAIIYFASGIIGNLISCLWEVMSGDYTRSIGASGAVFGIMGALLALVALKVLRGRTLQLPRIIAALAISLYDGFTVTSINNAAHVGGLLGGFIVGGIIGYTLILERRKQVGKRHEN